MRAQVQVWLLALPVCLLSLCSAFAQSDSGTTYWHPQRRFNVLVMERGSNPAHRLAQLTPTNPLLGSPGGVGNNPGVGGAMPIPPEWNLPGPGSQPAPSPAINLVGRWTYQATEEGIPEEVMIIFQPNGQYNQFIRFPQTPALGNQIIQVWGQYVLQGTSLTNTPAGAQVSNGPNPQQLCNLQTQRCITPNLQPSTVQLQPIDADTVQTPLGIAKRIAP